MSELFRTDDAAWTAAMDAARYAERRSDIVAKAVGAAAPLIVATELRRQAARLRGFAVIGGNAPNQLAVKTLRTIAEGLDIRADELDPTGGVS